MPTHLFEESARNRGFSLVAGVDEAGRGPLAGPVVAAACILPEGLTMDGVDDSKTLTPLQRFELYEKIIHTPGIDWAIGVVDSLRIDQINILQATFQAMLLAVSQLAKKPDYLLIDGSLAPSCDIPCESIILGDSLSYSIAAASIVAKETRDRIMVDYHAKWPQYGFDQHKGYATKQHFLAIEKYGACPIHRLSFEPFTNRLVLCKERFCQDLRPDFSPGHSAERAGIFEQAVKRERAAQENKDGSKIDENFLYRGLE